MTIRVGTSDIKDDDILDISINLKVDEISMSLPIDEMRSTFRASFETASAFKYNTEFIVLDGEKQIGIFYARELKQSGTGVYLLLGVSIIGILSERNFSGRYFNMGTEFAEALSEIVGEDITYVIEDESETFELEGFIGHCSQREAIRHLCMCCGVTVYNNKGVLSFRRTFGGLWTDSRYSTYSYQPDEVFNDFTVKDSNFYSHYSTDVYFFAKGERDGYETVKDTLTDEKYHYYTEKVTYVNTNYPESKPRNELYIQGEMLISSYSSASELLNKVKKYFAGGKSLKFRVIDSSSKDLGVGFYDGEKMLIGYPSEIDIAFGKNQTHGRANSITYSCAMAYYEEPRHINVNYFNESGDFLAFKQIIKGKEERYTVKHPLISLVVDNRHKIIYKAPESSNIYEDESYADPVDINVTCEVAAIQDGDIIEVHSVDNGYQIRDVLNIGGKVNG